MFFSLDRTVTRDKKAEYFVAVLIQKEKIRGQAVLFLNWNDNKLFLLTFGVQYLAFSIISWSNE